MAASSPAGMKRVAETGRVEGLMAERTEAQLLKSPEPSKASRMLLTCWRQQAPSAAVGTVGDSGGEADVAVVVRRTP